MARQSFTLREDTPEGGSYLQYYPNSGSGSASAGSASSGAASATYLRGDDIQFATERTLLNSLSYFQGYASDYKTVSLSWGASLQEPGVLPTPYELLLVYSPIGHPETIPEGQVLLRSRYISEFVHKNVEGLWAYYTLFVRFLSSSGLDDYYEPVRYLSVLLPIDYNTTDDMFSHIPSWYQALDERENGHLKTFLTIFGRDVDYIRTVLDYMMSMKDPAIAEPADLDDIAKDLGIQLQSHDLGANRLRKLLDNIGDIRRSKGTFEAIQKEISAITGSPVEVFWDVDEYGDPELNINVRPQRANLVKDPKLVNGVQTGLDGGSPRTNSLVAFDVGLPDTGWVEEDEEYETLGAYSGGVVGAGSIGAAGAEDGVLLIGTWTDAVLDDTPLDAVSYAEGALFDGGSPSDIGFIPITGSKQSWVGFPDPENGEYSVLETLYAEIPVKANDVFYFSIQAYDNDIRVQDDILSVGLYTSGGITEGSLITKTEEYTTVNGFNYWRITIPEDFETTEEGISIWSLAVLSLTFAPSANSSQDFFNNFTNVLFERNFIGEYFDGDTKLGGWITNGLTSISDYRWRDPEYDDSSLPAESFSVYSANYQKTKAILNKLITSILPVNLLSYFDPVYSNEEGVSTPGYVLRYDVIPGEELLYPG